MVEPSPEIVLIAGPNGAGKSTLARLLLPEAMPFLNADEIAKTLPDDIGPAHRDLDAGRLLLRRIDRLVAQRQRFAVETTLASRSLAPKIARLRESGYRFHLIFLYLPEPEMAVSRVAERVRRGGHDIPEETIRRRFDAGLKNLTTLYLPLADTWRIYRNVSTAGPKIVAEGSRGTGAAVHEPAVWATIHAKGAENADR